MSDSDYFTGPFEDGYRVFPENTPYSAWLYILGVIIGFIDGLFIYIMHKTSLRLPDINTHICSIKNKNKNIITKYKTKWNKFLYNYLLYSDYSMYYLDHLNEIQSKKEVLLNWKSTVNILGCNADTTSSIFIYIGFGLRIFHFVCGLLIFVLVFIVFIGGFGEFIIVVIKFETYANLIILCWLIYVLIFCLKYLGYHIYLLLHNICDKYKMWIVFYWRFISFIVILFGSVFVTNHETKKTGINSSDQDYFRWFAAIMVLRGSIWILINFILVFVVSILMIYRIFKQKIDYSIRINIVNDKFDVFQNKVNNDSMLNTNITAKENEKLKLKWWMLFVNVDPRDGRTKRIIYIVYVIIIWIIIIAFSIYLIILDIDEQTKSYRSLGKDNDRNEYYYVLMRLVLVAYYFIVIFNRGKYDALFCLWSGHYHVKFYEFLVKYNDDNSVPMDILSENKTIDDDSAVHTGDETTFKTIELVDDDSSKHMNNNKNGSKNGKRKQSLADTIQTEMDKRLEQLFDVETEIIVYENMVNNEYNIKTSLISYDLFWISIEDMNSDYFDFNKMCNMVKKLTLLAIVAVLSMIIGLGLVNIGLKNKANFAIENQIERSISYNIETEYPFCDQRFSDYLNILDMVYLTNVAYDTTDGYNDIAFQIEQWFINATDNGWELKYVQQNAPAFFHARNNKYNFDIIVVRGTKTFADKLEDLDLFTIPLALGAFSTIIPITTIFPSVFLTNFVNIASIIAENLIQGNSYKLRFDYSVYNYIRWNLYKEISPSNNITDYNLYITGHSLGGAIANIVASHLIYEGYINIKTLSVGSPGLLYNSKFFEMDQDAYISTSFEILMNNDIISAIDEHVGTQIWLQCTTPFITASCHQINNFMGDIINNCDERNINYDVINDFYTCIVDNIYNTDVGAFQNICLINRNNDGDLLYQGNTSIPINITPNYPR